MKQNREIITSRNNETVKFFASLQTKKGRDLARAFIAEGEKLTLEALEGGLPVTHILVLSEKSKSIFAKLSPYFNDERFSDTEIILLGEGAFSKISTENSPQGVISVIKYLDFFREMDIIYNVGFFQEPGERALILSSVRDPGNVGAVIRSATAFGVDHIILTADSADLYNPKTVRSAMGSLFRVKCTVVSDIIGSVKALISGGRRIFAAELSDTARPISDIDLLPTDIFIIGNEGHGIPTELSAAASGSVYLPISKKTESLNAAVAAAVFMWEQNR